MSVLCAALRNQIRPQPAQKKKKKKGKLAIDDEYCRVQSTLQNKSSFILDWLYDNLPPKYFSQLRDSINT